MAVYGERPRGRALDLGCAIGRATFELARHFEQVTGLDFSARFIRIGTRLQEEGFVHYTRLEEGEIVSFHEKHLAAVRAGRNADRVEFFQADACNLPANYTGYDLVLAANLIDRLYDPAKFLAHHPRADQPRRPAGPHLTLHLAEEFTEKEQMAGRLPR